MYPSIPILYNIFTTFLKYIYLFSNAAPINLFSLIYSYKKNVFLISLVILVLYSLHKQIAIIV